MCEPIEDVELSDLQEARKRHDQQIMQGETFREMFGTSFDELRAAVTHHDFEEVEQWTAHIESRACNLVEQFDCSWEAKQTK